MSASLKELSIIQLEKNRHQIAATDVIGRDKSFYISTTAKFEDMSLFETLIFDNNKLKEKGYVPTHEEGIGEFNKTGMKREEAIRNHRRAIIASAKNVLGVSNKKLTFVK
jgi:hypothetical protein